MADISIKGHSPILRQGYAKGGTVKVRDINKDGKKEGWEVARATGMQKEWVKKFLLKVVVAHTILQKMVEELKKVFGITFIKKENVVKK